MKYNLKFPVINNFILILEMSYNINENWQSQKIKRSEHNQEKVYSLGVNRNVFNARNAKVIKLVNGAEIVEFSSCSYLGLELDPRLAKSAMSVIGDLGVQFSVARTRLLPSVFLELESKLSRIFNGETVAFSTVGLVHLAVFPLLGAGELPSYPIAENGISWIMDRAAHASIQIQRGLLEQFGSVVRVDCGDCSDVEKACQNAVLNKRTPIVLSDSVGSMGGLLSVKPILNLVTEYNGYIYLDDAHGTSVFGQYGAGYVLSEFNNSFPSRLLLASSLSKAFGATGGCITLQSNDDAEVIRKFSTPYIFGGPISLPGVAACNASADIHLSGEVETLQQKLQQKLRYFDKCCNADNVLNRYGKMSIRGIVIGNEERAINIGHKLIELGFYATVAIYPTVARGSAIIRVAISVLHTEKQLLRFCQALEYCMNDEINSPQNLLATV